jgi:hypothetical protein
VEQLTECRDDARVAAQLEGTILLDARNASLADVACDYT